MKYGRLLAIGQLGWESTPDVGTDLCGRLRNRMATSALDGVSTIVTRHCVGSCTPSMGLPYPPCTIGATMSTIVRLLQHWGGHGRSVVLVAARAHWGGGGWPMSVKPSNRRQSGAHWCVHYLWCVNGRLGAGDPCPTPLLGHLYERQVRRLGYDLGPFVWPQATGGPRPLVSDLLPCPMMPVESSSRAPQLHSLLPYSVAPPAPVQPVPQVHFTLTRQKRFDQAPMHATHRVARCLTVACQGLREQRNEPLSGDSLVAANTLGHHFASNMRVPVQDCSDLLMRWTPFSPQVTDNHRGHVYAAVRVIDNTWRDDGGPAMLNELVALMEEAGVRPAYIQQPKFTRASRR